MLTDCTHQKQVTLGVCIMLVVVTIMFESVKRYMQDTVPVQLVDVLRAMFGEPPTFQQLPVPACQHLPVPPGNANGSHTTPRRRGDTPLPNIGDATPQG